jgi:hypothetical protein
MKRLRTYDDDCSEVGDCGEQNRHSAFGIRQLPIVTHPPCLSPRRTVKLFNLPCLFDSLNFSNTIARTNRANSDPCATLRIVYHGKYVKLVEKVSCFSFSFLACPAPICEHTYGLLEHQAQKTIYWITSTPRVRCSGTHRVN